MSRKTIEVDTLKTKINDMILHSRDDEANARAALALVLASVLHDTGNYTGYNFLTPLQMEKSISGKTAGIDHSKANKFEGLDETRVFYY